MLKNRLIPIMFLKNGHIVRSQNFETFQIIGDHLSQLERLSSWNADELVYIDITREDDVDFHRQDKKVVQKSSLLDLVEQISKSAFMPLTLGGGIVDVETAVTLIQKGADRVLINTKAHTTDTLLADIVKIIGSQAVVVGIDTKRVEGKIIPYVGGGKVKLETNIIDLAKRAEDLGAGELLLNSIDRDGSALGYDLDCINLVADAVKIPVIACGGVGNFGHFFDCLAEGKAAAVAAGNIFHFTENSYRRAKKFLLSRGANVRPFDQQVWLD